MSLCNLGNTACGGKPTVRVIHLESEIHVQLNELLETILAFRIGSRDKGIYFYEQIMRVKGRWWNPREKRRS